MKNEFIPYEQALALKELGFDEPCFGVYATKDGYVRKSAYDENGDAPTFSQAFRFFREKYNIDSWVQPFTSKKSNGDLYLPDESYSYFIFKDGVWVADEVDFLEPEEAELACLKKLIQISTQSKPENAELKPYIEYHPNGNVWIKGQKNSVGQQEGIWEYFWENGNIHCRIPYKEGKRNGIEEWFYPNGNIDYKTPYKEGKRDGIVEWFYENGNIQWRISYKEDKRDGIKEEFDEQGNIIETQLWKNGELIEITKH